MRSVLVNDDGAGRSVDDVMRTAQALQYVDSHEGEGCPVNWQPGEKSIGTNSDDAKAFFKEWA